MQYKAFFEGETIEAQSNVAISIARTTGTGSSQSIDITTVGGGTRTLNLFHQTQFARFGFGLNTGESVTVPADMTISVQSQTRVTWLD